MTLTIRTESPLAPEARALIEASEAALHAPCPPEERFGRAAEDLAEKGTQFLVARQDGVPVGCVALVDRLRYGEVKRLYVGAAARGNGIARALMEELERAARDIGLGCLLLETGAARQEAVGLCRSLGYVERGPVGGHPDIAPNLFMQKRIGLSLRGCEDAAQACMA